MLMAVVKWARITRRKLVDLADRVYVELQPFMGHFVEFRRVDSID